MFDLDREVTAWSTAVHAGRCHPAASVAELTDHLYCEIERARATGLSDEEAFRTAIALLGSASELTAEHDKNRSALGAACQVAANLDRPLPNPEHRRLVVAHALVWAALMIASAIVLKKTATAGPSSWPFGLIFFSLWWSSDRILRRALRTRPGGI